jgi:outer membrane protein TolC
LQRFQLAATYLTLTSNVVAAAVQEASLRAQIAATQEIIDIESQLLELLRRQNRLGQIAMADVVTQERRRRRPSRRCHRGRSNWRSNATC